MKHLKDGLIEGEVGRYHLNGVAGRGGWGIIYRASDVESGASYALKMSRERLDARGFNALYDELELVSRIEDPRVIQYIDYAHHRGRPVLVMELLSDLSLSQYMKQREDRPLTREEQLKVIAHLCSAVKAIHKADVIHCDLKPQNLVISDELVIKIVDFGLAKGLDDQGRVTSTVISGTPHFMAPEQLAVGRELSRATDVFAVALIIAWLLSTEPLWERSGVELLTWRIQNLSALPEGLRHLPKPIYEALIPALHEDPERRISDLSALRQAVSHAITPENIQLVPFISPLPKVSLTRSSISLKTREESMFNTTFLFTEDVADTLDIDEVNAVDTSVISAALLCVEDETLSGELSPEDAQRLERLGLGISEDLIDLFNVSDQLSVIPASASRSLKVSSDMINPEVRWEALSEIVSALKVQHLICLDLRRSDEMIYLTLYALSLEDQLVIARVEHSSLYRDLLNQLGNLATELAGALHVNLQCPRAERASLAEVVDLLFEARVRAIATWHSDVSVAIKLYRSAIERSPHDAIILAEAARVEARSSFIGDPPSAHALERASELAERACEMAPHHAQTCWALGYVRFYQGRRAEALKSLDQAIMFGGERAEVRDLIGRILCEEGPIERALAHLEHALLLNHEMTTAIDLARLYAYLDQWERVDELLSTPPQSASDYGAREITRARLTLWRPNLLNRILEDALTERSRDREREGRLFEALIDIFVSVKLSGELRDPHRAALLTFFDEAPEGGRLKALYAQFIVECLAHASGPQDPEALHWLNRATEVGVTDSLWRRYCPVLSLE